MPFDHILGWEHGLVNRPDPRAVRLQNLRGLSKAQNISVDKMGRIIGIGGLETHGEVPTQAAVLSPGSGLFTYGSDHWRGTNTIIDLGPGSNSASDEQGEVSGTSGWSSLGAGAEILATDGAVKQVGSFSIKLTAHADGPASAQLSSAITTVVGQKYLVHAWLRASTLHAVGTNLRVGTTSGGSQIAVSSKVTVVNTFQEKTVEFIAVGTSTYISVQTATNSETLNIDDFYITAIPQADLDTTWLALADVTNAQIDLWNRNDFTAFSAGLLDFGTVASFVGASAGNIDFPTTNTVTDSASSFLNSNIKAGRVYKVSGCSTTTANNILFVCDRVTAGTIYVRGTPFTVTASEAGTVTLTEYNPTDFHFVDDSLSVSPAGGGIALRPKQYRFVDRKHLFGAGASEDKYQDWYLNDVGLAPPTDIAAEADAGDQDASALTVGAGFEVGITVTAGTAASPGEWVAGTYIIANSFIYDDGQESELYIPATDEEFGTAVTDDSYLTITARAKGPYDERISGGRIYCRLDESDDAWVLLVDISMEQGARATLSGQYNAWNESDPSGSGALNVAYSAAFKSVRLNADTYESLSERDPGVKTEKFTSDNRFWDTSIIAGNRTFIASPRYTDAGGKTVHFRDRILYSKINQYDVFPIDNFIDVTGSDAEDYVKLGVYGSDLLCFKQQTLYIVDISDPLEFRMKEDANKGKYPKRGISHPGAYFETPNGPAWCNQWGIWLYNGVEIIDLLEDRIERSKHPLTYQGYLEFDQTDDYVIVSDDSNIQNIFDSGGTVSGWIYAKSDGEDDAGGIVNKSDTGVGWILRVEGESAGLVDLHFVQLNASTAGEWEARALVAINRWYHVALTYDSDSTSNDPLIYINGVSQTVTETATPNAARGSDVGKALYIGTNFAALGTWDGFMGGVTLHDSILGAAEIATLAAGAPPATAPVAEYRPQDITDSTWPDNSGNSLDGTVVGATFIYPDTWEHFWTDYSILGYHGKTNQIIIMRDCTGKWSSGKDYGDSWIVDLDMLAHTTGRRVFLGVTATSGILTIGSTYEITTYVSNDSFANVGAPSNATGVVFTAIHTTPTTWSNGSTLTQLAGGVFSNFATDWNGDLIIAEQFGANIITRKWTDKPQSQAVGLIDIRTLDLIGANIATIDTATDFVIHYKSSAAQTKPISYAADANDLFTAWTRLTGNFSASSKWQRLVISMGASAISFASIRLKVDNPTAAGTMELGPISVKYTESATKLE